MKFQLLFSVCVLPVLVLGQTTSQQHYAALCGSGQTTGTTTLGGEQYTYHCNKRATSSDMAGRTDGVNDPKDCTSRATGNAAMVGVTWRSGGQCYTSSAGPPVDSANSIFFEKASTPGGGTPNPCCQERNNLQTELLACKAARDQFQSDLTTCQAGSATCQASLTSCLAGAATCQASLTSCQGDLTTCKASIPAPSTRVSSCQGITTTQGFSNESQAGHKWSVNCNSISGQGIINRPADTVAGLPECVDKCAQNPSCKVALILPQARNNCVMYTSYTPPRAGAGNHFAIKQ